MLNVKTCPMASCRHHCETKGFGNLSFHQKQRRDCFAALDDFKLLKRHFTLSTYNRGIYFRFSLVQAMPSPSSMILRLSCQIDSVPKIRVVLGGFQGFLDEFRGKFGGVVV